jgi:hypothetical protein
LLDKEHKGFLVKEDMIRILCTESVQAFHYRKVLVSSPALETPTITAELKREEDRERRIEKKVNKLFSLADWNNDGKLSYSEFLFAMAEGSSSDVRDFLRMNSNHLNSFYGSHPNANRPSILSPAGSPLKSPQNNPKFARQVRNFFFLCFSVLSDVSFSEK